MLASISADHDAETILDVWLGVNLACVGWTLHRREGDGVGRVIVVLVAMAICSVAVIASSAIAVTCRGASVAIGAAGEGEAFGGEHCCGKAGERICKSSAGA